MKELKAELLKYRRTFTGKLIVWIPLLLFMPLSLA